MKRSNDCPDTCAVCWLDRELDAAFEGLSQAPTSYLAGLGPLLDRMDSLGVAAFDRHSELSTDARDAAYVAAEYIVEWRRGEVER